MDPDLSISSYYCGDLQAKWHQLPVTSSPSQKLSDLFLLSLPWNQVKYELGNIHVLDTGCGSGNLGMRLMEWSHHAISSYTGIDIKEHPDWEVLHNKDSGLSFVSGNVEELLSRIPDKINFILSQSAIEHFDHDILIRA